MPDGSADEDARAQPLLALARVHLRFGWIALLVFATLGALLETLHAFKSGAYLGVGNEMRRLMWTLAHAHGIGLSLLHMGFAATLRVGFDAVPPRGVVASQLLRWATVLLPGGFFLGGVAPYEGDPGVGVWLAPLGVALLWAALLVVALDLVSAKR